jgi:hypothetical protein
MHEWILQVHFMREFQILARAQKCGYARTLAVLQEQCTLMLWHAAASFLRSFKRLRAHSYNARPKTQVCLICYCEDLKTLKCWRTSYSDRSNRNLTLRRLLGGEDPGFSNKTQSLTRRTEDLRKSLDKFWKCWKQRMFTGAPGTSSHTPREG